ncbi:MAG UNVERIFIED_CONTAM: hypothetical protein LVR29_27010 [Microcystis novacekii LVE1205-3]
MRVPHSEDFPVIIGSIILCNSLNEMGYRLKRVVKAKPQKKIPETDAIFEQIHSVNQQIRC